MKKSGFGVKQVVSVICCIVAAVDVFLLGAYLFTGVSTSHNTEAQ